MEDKETIKEFTDKELKDEYGIITNEMVRRGFIHEQNFERFENE